MPVARASVFSPCTTSSKFSGHGNSLNGVQGWESKFSALGKVEQAKDCILAPVTFYLKFFATIGIPAGSRRKHTL